MMVDDFLELVSSGTQKSSEGLIPSLIIQRPLTEISKKWPLVIKNAETALVAAGIDQEPFVTKLTDYDLGSDDIGGWVFSRIGNDIHDVSLIAAPRTACSLLPEPFILPMLAQRDEHEPIYVIAVSQSDPRLYRICGKSIRDETQALEFRSFEEMKSVREPMASLDHHSSGSVPSGGGAANVNRHALGVSADDYQDVLLDDFMTGLGNTIEETFRGTGRTLVVAGGPRRAGWLMENLSLPEMLDTHIDAAGEGLDADRLIAEVTKIVSTRRAARQTTHLDTLRASDSRADGISTIQRKAAEGAVDTLYIAERHNGLIRGDNDERLKPEPIDTNGPLAQVNTVATAALRTGADFVFVDDGETNNPDGISAVLRY